MRAVLVTNHYVHSEKFENLFSLLIDSANSRGITLNRVSNQDILVDPSIVDYADFILFWDKDIHAAKMLEARGHRLFNSSSAIEACDDKALTQIIVSNAGIRCAESVFSPKLYHYIDWDRVPELPQIEKKIGYPMVIKECFGSFGKKVYLANDRDELFSILSTMDTRPFMFQRYIKESFARDIRINVVGGKVVAAMVRENKSGDFRANVAVGGTGKAYIPTSDEAEMAIKAAAALGLDFGGIDILFGEDGPIFCEANSNMHFKGMLDCTGINTADYIFDYILSVIKNN